MHSLIKIGRLFYGGGIISYGIQQIVIRDFRRQILPGFPSWAHEYSVFPIITGGLMILSGVVIMGLFHFKNITLKRVCIYLGCYFLFLILVSHIPYLLFVYPHKLSHLGSWGDLLYELAFAGGAFVIAASDTERVSLSDTKSIYLRIHEKYSLWGRIFYCTTIILFGFNHFAYDISGMVPKWMGIPEFWSYFGGAALLASGVAIMFKFHTRFIAMLLAIMLFLWFILIHIPSVVAAAYPTNGNQIVSAFDALLFCGIALVLGFTKENDGLINKNIYNLE